jgi:capsular exopolysaccharide synthesis family protein
LRRRPAHREENGEVVTPKSSSESHGAPSAEPEVHLRDYWYVLLKRRWIMAAVVLAIVSLSAAISFLRMPTYKAQSLIEVNRGTVNLGQDALVEDRLPGNIEFYPTQRRILESRTLAERTAERLELWTHPLFQVEEAESAGDVKDKAVEKLKDMLRVNVIRNTQLIEVSFITPDPKLSADLANAQVQSYVGFSSEASLGVAKSTTSFLREQIEKLQVDIQKKEAMLQDYSQQQDIVMVDQKENIVIQQLEDFNRRLTETQAERAEAEARYRSLRSAEPDSINEVRESRTIQNLKQEYASLQKQHAELATKFKSDWPELKRVQSAMRELEQEIERESRNVTNQVIAGARVEYQAALRRESLLKQELDNQKGEAQDLSMLAADYNRVKAELDNQREMLQQLLRRQSETGLTAEFGERQPVNVRIVETAVPPKWRYEPSVTKNLLIGVVVGISLAVGLVFFLDYWDTSIYTVEDLRRAVPLAYLGMIPRMKPGQEGRALSAGRKGTVQGNRESRQTALAPIGRSLPAVPSSHTTLDQSIVRERFKFLRGGLLLSSAGGVPRTVLVTSPEKHAGKTFVVSNLAASLAEMNKSVLIVDADLRNPHLHKVFGIRNRVGLTNVLTGQMAFEDGCILKTTVPNLFVLLAGPLSPTPAELLSSEAMEQALEQALRHFDFVLVDSAPLLPVIDSHVLTSRCDAVVLVSRSGQTTRPAVKASADLVEKVNGKITGVVLNDVDLKDWAQNYYYGHYTYEYGTYSQEGSPVNLKGRRS